MAVAGIRLDINSAELRKLRDEILRLFPAAQAAQKFAPIVRRAIQPMTQTLRSITPVGPTGNLLRAVDSKVVTYAQTGVVVGVVGFTRAGNGASESAAGGGVREGRDRAFHQWWLEYGTKERRVTTAKARVYARRSPTKPFSRRRNGRVELVTGRGVLHTVQELTPTFIASSFDTLGPFRIDVASGRGGRVQTTPGSPHAFFRKSKTPIVIPGMAPGGAGGQPPLETAWNRTKGEMAASLQRDLSLTIEQAWAALRFRSSGSSNSTDNL
jgi:hypothetical protein